jgi:hypothetical protein
MPVAPLPCPLCAGFIQVDSDWSGREVACPLCGGAFVVPPPPTYPSPVVPSPPPTQVVSSDSADLLPPGAAATASVVVSPPLDELLPPGAASACAPPESDDVSAKSYVPIVITKPTKAPASTRQSPPASAVSRLTPKERAERRMVKNAILFGVCIVALVIVFYLLAR